MRPVVTDQVAWSVGPGNHVLDGGPYPRMGRGNFKGGRCAHCKVWGHSVVIYVNTAEPIEMPFGLWARKAVGIMC